MPRESEFPLAMIGQVNRNKNAFQIENSSYKRWRKKGLATETDGIAY